MSPPTVPAGPTIKRRTRQFYEDINSSLDSQPWAEHSIFLNYGYMGDDDDHSGLNGRGEAMVLQLIDAVPLLGRRVLDIGSGRGGTLRTIGQRFRPAALIGLDLSLRAVAFANNAHGHLACRFIQGDAESLPFGDASFDVVLNIESSSCYPNIRAFFEGVHRVLRPFGYFLWADAFPPESFDAHLAALDEIGFDLENDHSITANVLRACAEDARVHVAAFADRNPHEMAEILAALGSDFFSAMESGLLDYRSLRLRRRNVLQVGRDEAATRSDRLTSSAAKPSAYQAAHERARARRHRTGVRGLT